MKTITLKHKRGVDDLKGLFAYIGNSQGDTSCSNVVHSDKAAGGWMSFVFSCEETQEAIDSEVAARKLYNENYIQELVDTGKFGEEYETTVQFAPHPEFDSPSVKPLESYSFHIIDLSK